MLRIHDVRGFARVLEDRAGDDAAVWRSLTGAWRPDRVSGRMQGAAVGVVEPSPQEPSPRGGDALEQGLTHEVVAEAEAEAVDAEDAPFAQALELLDRASPASTPSSSASGSGANGCSSNEAAMRMRQAHSPSARHWASSASVSVFDGAASSRTQAPPRPAAGRRRLTRADRRFRAARARRARAARAGPGGPRRGVRRRAGDVRPSGAADVTIAARRTLPRRRR